MKFDRTKLITFFTLLALCLALRIDSIASEPGEADARHWKTIPAVRIPDAEVIEEVYHPISHIPDEQYNARYTPAVRHYMENVVTKSIQRKWELMTRHNSQSLYAETVQDHELPPCANFSIDKSGRLLWIVLDTRPGAYAQVLLRAIVRSSPFPAFPRSLPDQISLRVPFFGPKADCMQPELVENTKPKRPDWQVDIDKAKTLNESAKSSARAGQFAEADRKFQDALYNDPNDSSISTNVALWSLLMDRETWSSTATKVRRVQQSASSQKHWDKIMAEHDAEIRRLKKLAPSSQDAQTSLAALLLSLMK